MAWTSSVFLEGGGRGAGKRQEFCVSAVAGHLEGHGRVSEGVKCIVYIFYLGAMTRLALLYDYFIQHDELLGGKQAVDH